MRTELAPLVRECGFTGTYREFRLREGDQEGVLQFQGSKYNRGTDYRFTVNLMIRDRTTGHTRTHHRLGGLTPARRDTWWTVVPGRPTLLVAQELADAICNFGAVALRMDMAYPDSDEHVSDGRSPSEKRQSQMSRMRAHAEARQW